MKESLLNNYTDQLFWSQTVIPHLSRLLIKAGYSNEKHDIYLKWYHDHISPALGPVVGGSPHFDSFCNDDFTPIELSWNHQWKDQETHSIARICVEPIHRLAGTSQDPFNQLMIVQLVEKVSKLPDIDCRWFDHFRKRFFVQREHASEVHEKMAANEHVTVASMAFDLKDGQLFPKIYFFPIIKEIQSGMSGRTLIRQAIFDLDTESLSFMSSLAILESYVESRPDLKLRFECLSFDCVLPAQSRIKIYVRTLYTSLDAVQDIYCLGGRLDDSETRSGMEALRTLWSLLFPTASANEELPHCSHRTAGIIFNFELRSGRPSPKSKVYLPLRHYCANDGHIASIIASFFTKEGLIARGASYVHDIQEIFPLPDQTKTIGRHSYVGLSCSEKAGVSLTTYYNPMIFSDGDELDGEGKLVGPASKKQRHQH